MKLRNNKILVLIVCLIFDVYGMEIDEKVSNQFKQQQLVLYQQNYHSKNFGNMFEISLIHSAYLISYHVISKKLKPTNVKRSFQEKKQIVSNFRKLYPHLFLSVLNQLNRKKKQHNVAIDNLVQKLSEINLDCFASLRLR